MARSERQAQIAELIRQTDFIGVEDLAQHFQVTTQTIRRDLNMLCELGIARRVHGGVQSMNTPGNVAYAWRQILNLDAKQTIAREVARHVPNGVSIAFSIGTTPEIVSKALLAHTHLRVFTNNLSIAFLACANPTFEITIAGGRLRNEDRDVMGSGMESLFGAYKVDIGIYGVAGVDEDGTLLDFYEEEVRARQIIRENSRSSYLVLDQSKFGRAAHVRGGRIDEATKIFCDRTPPAAIHHLIRQSGAQLILCRKDARS
ncbi:MAG TPA: DeoR/GlpR family DNA-binding transcription regulator [Desulfobacterales bacterium]